jgi:hypothetical protein
LKEAEALEKWEAKVERAAGEIYLLVEKDQRVHFRGFDEDPISMWKMLEAAHLSKKPGTRFNAYDDLFSIRKEDKETLIDLGVRIENAMAKIQNLRSSSFTIEMLDEELQCRNAPTKRLFRPNEPRGPRRARQARDGHRTL